MGAGPVPGAGIPTVAGEAVGPAAVGMRIVAAQDNLPAWEVEEQGAQAEEIAAKRRMLPVAAVVLHCPVVSAEAEVAACCRVAVAVGFVDPYFLLPDHRCKS